MILLPGMKKSKTELVEVNVIRTDLDTQSRVKLAPETVELYAAAMRKRAGLPRILLFKDKAVDGYILVDGMHRLEAHKLVCPDFPIQAEVVKGTLEEARWFSYGMNATHGLNRSNADKNRAVRLALQHKMGADKSNCEIAAHVGVDEKLVRRVREELESSSALPKSTKRVGRNGRMINTEKIGKSKKQASEKKTEIAAPHEETKEVNSVAADQPKFRPGSLPTKKYVGETQLKPIPRDRPDILVANLMAFFPKEFTPNAVRESFKMLHDRYGDEVIGPLLDELNEKYRPQK